MIQEFIYHRSSSARDIFPLKQEARAVARDKTMANVPCYIYMNGYPGVGKLAIATALQKLLPDSKVYHNHLMIDPIKPIIERTSPQYEAARKMLRRALLGLIATAEEAQPTTWIFTDSRERSAAGATAAKDYQDAAHERGALFISIVLNCDLEENIRRMTCPKRESGQTTKLRDPKILRKIRDVEALHQSGGPNELHLDVTHISPGEAAEIIVEHIIGVKQNRYEDA